MVFTPVDKIVVELFHLDTMATGFVKINKTEEKLHQLMGV